MSLLTFEKMSERNGEKEKKGRRIAVAVDESAESMYALSWLLQNLVPQDAQITLVLIYVKPPPPVYSTLNATGYMFSGDVVANIHKYGRDLATSVMERAKAVYQGFNNIKIEESIGSGDAKDVICRMVEKLNADILVIGSHGYGFIKRALLGSVSDHCAKHVKIPLLIIKRPKN